MHSDPSHPAPYPLKALNWVALVIKPTSLQAAAQYPCVFLSSSASPHISSAKALISVSEVLLAISACNRLWLDLSSAE